jgi:hypothetical protein
MNCMWFYLGIKNIMSILKRLFNVVYVSENDTQIILRGVRTITLAQDIMGVWSTSKIESHMFTKFRSSEISFPKFFAPDFHYMLAAIRDKYRYRRTSKSVINRALEELEQFTWLSKLTQPVSKILDRTKLSLFKLTPLKHQLEFFDIYEDRVQRYGLTGYLLSASAGSGKTLAGLMLAEMLKSDLVVLVVPKNSVHKVWSRHLSEEYKVPQEHWIVSDGKPYKKERFIITHYEALDKALHEIKHVTHGNTTIILDESHNMNEAESLRTQLFIDLCRTTKSKNVLWSSGTPIKALGYESIPLLRTIDPLFTPDVEERYKKIFGRNAKRALDILRNRMGMISFKVEKSEIVDNKPTSRIIKVKIPNGDDYTLESVRREMSAFITQRLKYYKDNFKKYESIYNEGISEFKSTLQTKEEKNDLAVYQTYIKTIRSGYDPRTMQTEVKYCNIYEQRNIIPALPIALRADFKNARSVVKYTDLKVLGEALGGILGRKRAKCHVDMVPYMTLPEIIEGAAKKTVIFTSYVEVVKAIDESLKKERLKPVLVYGDTTSNLSGLVTKFEKDDDANPLIATYQSLSTAVPLIVANVAVFTNNPFRDHELTQAKARVDRLGQDTPVEFVHIELDTGDKPNVSTRSRDILEWSREQITQILGKSYSDDIIGSAITTESIDDEILSDYGSVSIATEYYSDCGCEDIEVAEELPDDVNTDIVL